MNHLLRSMISPFIFRLNIHAVALVCLLALAHNGYADKATAPAGEELQFIHISPTIVPLKINASGESSDDTPELVFSFPTSDELRTLTVECNWFPLGYPSYMFPQEIKSNIQPNSTKLRLKLPNIQHFGIYQVLANIKPNRVLHFEPGTYGHAMVAVIPDNSNNEDNSRSPFGIGLNLTNLGPGNNPHTFISLVRAMGVRMARIPLPMNIKASDEQHKIAAAETIKTIRQLQRANIRVVPIINARNVLPPTADSVPQPYLDRFARRIVDYAKLLGTATAEDDAVTTWELSGGTTSLDDLNPKLFAGLFKTTRHALDIVSPTMELPLPDAGTTWTEKFLEQVKTFVPADNPIALSSLQVFHHTTVSDLWCQFDGQRQLFTQHGFHTGKASISQIGWTANHSSSWQERQADYLVQSYVSALGKGYHRIFWEDLIYNGSISDNMSYELISGRNMDPRSGLVSFAAMVHLLEKTQFVKSATLGCGVQIHFFREAHDNAEIAVLWSEEDAGTLTPGIGTTIPSDWQFFDQFANARPLHRSTNNLIPISRTPIYLRSLSGGIEQELQKWKLFGFRQIEVLPMSPPKLEKGTQFGLIVQNKTNSTLQGKLLLESADISLQCTNELNLPAFTTTTLPVTVTQFNRRPDNQYPVITILNNDRVTSDSAYTDMTLSERIIYRGTILADGDFSDWASAMPVYKVLQRDMDDITPSIDWSSSATAHFMYDDTNLYFAAKLDEKTLRILGRDVARKVPGLHLTVQTLLPDQTYGKTFATDIRTNFEGKIEDVTTLPNGIQVAWRNRVNTGVGERSVEAAIPLSLLPDFRPTDGTVIRLSVTSNAINQEEPDGMRKHEEPHTFILQTHQ